MGNMLKTFIKTIIILIITYLVFGTVKVIAFAPEQTWEEKFSQLTPKQKAQHFAKQYGANYTEMDKVIICESNWRSDVYGDGGKAYSYAQFHKPTFERWTKEINKDLSYSNPIDHLELMAYAFGQGVKYKKHWTCYTKIYK